ncbi:MAG: hypothetical protein IPG57_08530 [Burkholderiales bacterium]|nr:hypothetical protein [Burkholderiales bacterium]
MREEEGLGLDLDEVDRIAVLAQDVHPHQEGAVGNGRLEQSDPVLTQQLGGPGQRLGVAGGGDLDAAGEHQLGQLADLESPIGQRGQEGVVRLGVGPALRLAGVVQLGRAFNGQLEARFRQVAWSGHGTSSL